MTLDKALTCPSCGVVLAHARYRRFPPQLRLSSPEGPPIVPSGGELLRMLARQRGDQDALEFLGRHSRRWCSS